MKTNKEKSQRQDAASHGKTKEYIRTIKEIVADAKDTLGTFEFTSVTEQLLIHGIICGNITREQQKMSINARSYQIYGKLLKHLYNTNVGYALSNILIDENIDEETKTYMCDLFDYAVQEAVTIGKVMDEES